ncbi:hypothetical protein FF011L_25950 [Roseimaritima multifibrata]|uniref:Uncharacterized protein n=1 Tax=Roseimaritima multifibrata TaxID=1930274 RepID=A0A517MG16_9BACT|nr:hypothetical protein [Roseimaritima multifibrata]QDS93822.1 hypothetical protein FF011L_25950 [Roseimaritima multifibrata]
MRDFINLAKAVGPIQQRTFEWTPGISFHSKPFRRRSIDCFVGPAARLFDGVVTGILGGTVIVHVSIKANFCHSINAVHRLPGYFLIGHEIGSIRILANSIGSPKTVGENFRGAAICVELVGVVKAFLEIGFAVAL